MNTDNVNLNPPEEVPFGVIHHELSSITPSASDIGELWDSYLADNMGVCMLKYMIAKSKDPDIKSVLQEAFKTTNQRLQTMKDLLTMANYPLPEGFGEEDVDINAPELFSETFSLAYTQQMHFYISLKYNFGLGRSTRKDFRAFFAESIITSNDIYQKATDVLAAKGIIMKAPSINPPETIEKVNSKSYYGSIIAGKRPLNVIEISQLFGLIRSQFLVSIVNLGFSQVIQDKKIKALTFRGVEECNERKRYLTKFLEEDYLTLSIPSSLQVSSSIQSPFSDKLMLYHTTLVTAFTLLGIGFALSNTARRDLISAYNKMISEILDCAKEGADLLIENGWLERVPEATDRKKLVQ